MQRYGAYGSQRTTQGYYVDLGTRTPSGACEILDWFVYGLKSWTDFLDLIGIEEVLAARARDNRYTALKIVLYRRRVACNFERAPAHRWAGVFAGVGIPLLAATLAQRLDCPGLTILFEGGVIGAFVEPGKLPALH